VTERLALAGVVVAAVAFRVVLGVGNHGMYWPDEIYQSLEPAHGLVFGEGLLPWEYVDGARTWVLPGLLAALLGVTAAVGVDHPSSYLVVVQLAFVAVAAATVVATFALARAAGASRWAAVAGSAAFGLAPPAIYFGHRALSENVSALAVAGGLALVLASGGEAAREGRPGGVAGVGRPRDVAGAGRPGGVAGGGRPRRLLGAGCALLAFAVLLRLQNGIFCAALLAVLAARRDGPSLRDAAAVFAGGALVLGLLDLLTWGRFLGSARTYVRENVAEGRASEFGVEPFTYYFEHLWTSMPLLIAAVAVLAVLGAVRRPGLFLIAAAYLLAHSLVEHKELRFVLPVLPILCALAAVGIDALAGRRRQVAVAAVVVLAAVSALRAHSLTWGDLGSGSGPEEVTAWHHFADVNRLLLDAHDRDDLCGLKLEQQDRVWSGGYAYLHREVPYYARGEPPGRFNYVIAPVGPTATGHEVVRYDGAFQLVRVADRCRSDPAFLFDRL
jgi:hypothetical protein